MKRSPGCVCITNPLRGRHSQVSVLVVWQSEGPHSSACSMNSPAPQDTGTQPGHSSTRSWDTARAELYRDLGCRELVGRNMHKGRKKQSGHTRSCWSIPSLPPWQVHHLQIIRMDTGKKIWEIQQQQRMRKEGMCMLITS